MSSPAWGRGGKVNTSPIGLVLLDIERKTMSDYQILAWQTLLRPPVSSDEPPVLPMTPLKSLACRNSVTSFAALVTARQPVESACLVFTQLQCGNDHIPCDAFQAYLVGPVPVPEAGVVSDPLYPVECFPVDKSAAVYVNVRVPKGIAAGVYRGNVELTVDGETVASNDVEIEVADVDLPDIHDWNFFLNVWMNPGAVARWHGVQMWSDEHFDLLRPYVEDLAAHGQKTAVVPICYQPWGTQTRDPYPNTVKWTKRGDSYEFDFSVFDRYIRLHEECGIDKAIHCYSIVQGPGITDSSVITYIDAQSGEERLLQTVVGDEEYVRAWGQFFAAFREHLTERGWFEKVYVAFDEKPAEVMSKLFGFLDEYASDFRVSLAGNIESRLQKKLDDLSLQIGFDERGVGVKTPLERSANAVADLLDPGNVCAVTKDCPEKVLTTYYVCCGPEFPNTFLHSPLVESRMLPFLSVQGGYDGFLRWSYNDWSDSPYEHPEWGHWLTGDTFFVYPGECGPVSSLRWEQLREGIQDYELAMIASANIQDPEEMIDYEQAVALACRNVDGRTKSIGDIEIARRLLIPIAEHGSQG